MEVFKGVTQTWGSKSVQDLAIYNLFLVYFI